MDRDSLHTFIESVNGTSHLRIEHDYGDGFVRLQTSEAERRQAAQDIQCSENIVLELLRNARDAHASHIFVAVSRDGDKRIITVVDDGDGIPRSMHDLIFEPRVTSKLNTSHMDEWGLHGRGMALFSIAVNSESAEVAYSDIDLGTSIRVQTDLNKLSEKADQSSFPTFDLDEGKKVNVRGPRNILRTVCEFAIACHGSCSVMIGSPAEICATMHAYGVSTLSTVERLFCSDPDEIVITKRLAVCGDPKSFADQAEELGLAISERTARRILDGEIEVQPPILERISINSKNSAPARRGKRDESTDNRSFKLLPKDKEQLVDAVSRSFNSIAEAYYLEGGVTPSVTVKRDRIVITVPVVKKP